MYLVFTRMPGESYRRRLRLLMMCVCVTSFERNYLPCVLIRTVSSRGKKCWTSQRGKRGGGGGGGGGGGRRCGDYSTTMHYV